MAESPNREGASSDPSSQPVPAPEQQGVGNPASQTQTGQTDAVEVSVKLDKDAIAALQALALEQGVSMTVALQNAIATDKYLSDQAKSGSQILIKEPGTKFPRELIRRSRP